MVSKKNLVSLVLRIGLGFTFIYTGISAFLNPSSWIGFIPEFLRFDFVLNLHIIFNLILGVWLLSGKKTYYSANVSAVVLFLIIGFNINSMEIVFRDVGLLFMAIALAILHKR